MPVRNEAPFLGCTLRAATRWCDHVVVLNHASMDATPEILADVARETGRVTVIEEQGGTWREMDHRQRLLLKARSLGATHIAIVDADELLTGNLLPLIREQIQQLPPGGVLQVGMPCMWRSLDRYRVDPGIWSNRRDLAIAFCDRPDLRWERKSNGEEHHGREPKNSRCAARAVGWAGGVMHMQWVDWRRLTAKHACYKMIERIKYPHKPVGEIERLYSLALNESGLQTVEAPADWWEPYRDLRRHIVLDAEPWQERECRRMLEQHGAQTFAGLNLFGVVECKPENCAAV